MLLSRDAILEAKDLKTEDVDVPEWGGVVRLSEMTGIARDSYEESLTSGPNRKINMQNIRARLVAACVVDENGSPLFSEADLVPLGKKSGGVLDRLFDLASKLNGRREDAAKNSDAAPSGGSTSASA